MRESLRDIGRIEHIKDAINRIATFLDGVTYEQFQNDPILYYAIVKNIEIIGEAAYMLTQEFTDSHPEVEWPVIVKMRHVLVHGYYRLDEKEIWHTATRNVPQLKEPIEKTLLLLQQDQDNRLNDNETICQ